MRTASEKADILAKICADKKQHVAQRKLKKPLHILHEQIKLAHTPYNFEKKLRDKISKQQNAIIAEVKKGSPSAGVIRENFDPVKIAKIYESLGASCLSVLTDEKYFMGNDIFLQNIRGKTNLPLLRKDFIVDEYQIYESRFLGADCILLILSALDVQQAKDFENLAHELGMDVLIETHDRNEIEHALQMQSPLIGINNRNLKTMCVDLNTTLLLKKMIPDDKIIICESGIHHNRDIRRMNEHEVFCFLIGEYFMRENDIEKAWKTLFL